MIFGSVCSGIEAASVAWHPMGWQAAFLSEIESFPCSVLAHHYPTVPNLGDMTKFKEWPDAAINVLVGGTPCQSFSVAGLRKGLDDPRGNLMLTYLAIADRYRPRWLVWENVPGVLSSNGGRDFGTFLGGLGQLGYGFAYRILDAQYFGVAQRRRRVFVVGCLGDWRRAAAVLFERHSLQGNTPPRRKEGQVVAGTITKGAFTGGAGGRPEGAAGNHFLPIGIDEECNATIDGFGPLLRGGQGGTHAAVASWPADVASCLDAHFGDKMGLENQHINQGAPLFVPSVAYSMITANTNANGLGVSKEIAPTLDRAQPCAVAYPINTQIATRCEALGEGTGLGIGADGDPGYTLQAAHSHAVAFAQNTRDEVRLVNGDGAIAGALAAEAGMKQQTYLAFNVDAKPDEMRFDPHVSATLTKSQHSGVMLDASTETLYSKGIKLEGGMYASAQERDTRALLRELRKEVGEKAFTEWGLGILNSLQPEKVLQSDLHGTEVRLPAFSRCWMVYCSLSRQEERGAGFVQSVRESQREGCSPFGWQPSEQRAIQLGTYLSELSQPGSQAKRHMLNMWEASEGVGLLRQALPAFQKVGRPIVDEEEPAHGGMQVRRLTVAECEFLQGFPRGYTQVPYRGKPAADGPRYKALGNSMAVPVMGWIGTRIQAVDEVLR